MPPRKKSEGKRRTRELTEFRECSVCECVVNSQNFAIHTEMCFTNDSCVDCLTRLNKNGELSHSFIKKHRFYGSIINRNQRMLEDLQLLPSICQERCVMINTEVSKQCQLIRGDLVMLRNVYGHRIVLTLWPSNVVKFDNIVLSDDRKMVFQVNQGDWIEIELFYLDRIPAKELLLEPVLNHIGSWQSTLISQLKFQENEQFYTVGNELLLKTNSETHKLKVVKIEGDFSNVNKIIESSDTIANCTIAENIDETENSLLESEHGVEISSLKLNVSFQDDTSISESPHAHELSSSLNNSLRDRFRTPRVNLWECTRNEKIENEFFYINHRTNIIILPENSINNSVLKINDVLNNVKSGGYEKEMEILRKLCDNKLKSTRTGFELFNWTGVLIHGITGVGKLSLVRALVAEINWNLILVNSWEISSKYFGDSEQRLKRVFSDAKKRFPSIILFKKIEALCSKQRNFRTDLENRITNTLKYEMENLQNHCVIVFGTTDNIEKIDLDLRRPGRFDKEIELNVPTKSARIKIFKTLLHGVHHTLTENEFSSLANNTSGLVASQIGFICKQAMLHVIKRMQSNCVLVKMRFEGGEEFLCDSTNSLNYSDLLYVLKTTSPNITCENTLHVSKVSWEDIAVKEEIRETLERCILWSLKHPHELRRCKINASTGVLLYGPPGCSKTLIAAALANESGFNFMAIKGPELYNKFVGETEKAVKSIFDRAKKYAPTILFIDEFDGLITGRDESLVNISQVENSVRSVLLTEMNGIQLLDNVAIVAATNRPQCIDEALLRSGRLGTKIYIPLPDENIRRKIFQIQFRHRPIGDDVDLNVLVSKTEKFSGAQVVQLCNDSAYLALQAKEKCIEMIHFINALAVNKPNVSEALIQCNEEFYLKNSNID